MSLDLKTSIILFAMYLKDFPNGINASEGLEEFSQSHPEAAAKIELENLTNLSKDEYPDDLFMIEDSILKSNSISNFATAFRIKRVDGIAIKFYTDVLSNDPYLRRSCEDRNKFDQAVSDWKDAERQEGRFHTSCPPSTIIVSLQKKWRVLETGKIDDEKILVWVEGTKNSDKKTLSKKERIKKAAYRVRNARKELEKNREGIEIDQIDFGSESNTAVHIGTRLTQEINIKNNGEADCQVEIKCTAAERKQVKLVGSKKFDLDVGMIESVIIDYTPKVFGVMRCIISFEITYNSDNNKERPFSIVRYISVTCGDPDAEEILKATSSYKRKKKVADENAFRDPITLKNDSMSGRMKFARKLENTRIPEDWHQAVTDKDAEAENALTKLYFGEENQKNIEVSSLSFPQHLKMQNYVEIFEKLLFAEEIQMKIDIQQYDLANVSMLKRPRSLRLHVPGLAESRPSVLRGDKIFVSYKDGSKPKCYEGVVESIEMEDCIITFPNEFQNKYLEGESVDVRFRFKRTGILISHQALKAIKEEHAQIIFPTKVDEILSLCKKEYDGPNKLVLYNRNLNDEQRAAVFGAVASVARPIPYLIFGPPGTGKTVTVVEAILQTLKASTLGVDTKILVCAPSNAATDLLCERLAAYLTPQQMIRVNAYSRDEKSIPQSLMKFTNFSTEENGFAFPPLDELMTKQVVIMTIASAGKLPNNGIVKHFTNIFIDEAGHAVETESISCFVETMKPNASICLAGDPKQLGPIIRSELARYFGFATSLLERLYMLPIYGRKLMQNSVSDDIDTTDNEKYDSRIITKLVKNYRTHPAILDLPNKIFYDSDLIPSADRMTSHNLDRWEHLPVKGFPLIFCGVQGQDTREGNSPSWFNSEECQVIKNYVHLLVNETRTNRCLPKEIGIVTPYHKQAQKLRLLMKAADYGDVTVGSVEEFQGSERRVIIISTVRSTVEYLDFDNKHKLGFVSNPKRFNVAITRAQALLIVVGNPYVLQHDRNWRDLLEYCVEYKSYVGCEYNPREQQNTDVDDLVEGLATTSIDDRKNENKSFAISTLTEQENPEWRYEE